MRTWVVRCISEPLMVAILVLVAAIGTLAYYTSVAARQASIAARDAERAATLAREPRLTALVEGRGAEARYDIAVNNSAALNFRTWCVVFLRNGQRQLGISQNQVAENRYETPEFSAGFRGAPLATCAHFSGETLDNRHPADLVYLYATYRTYDAAVREREWAFEWSDQAKSYVDLRPDTLPDYQNLEQLARAVTGYERLKAAPQ
ncbi:MAG: hypothetical protein JOY59_02070 [Candidatus Eremiobacteraeota bacterium]|nr:hypothetical protein [Candidatus Eremiobacteraeota bacterium]